MSVSLYYDMNTDKYYLINNADGHMTRVNSNTEYVKEFDAALTGSVGYHERLEYALSKNKPGYMPLKARSLHPRHLFYAPAPDKLVNYTQCPAPKCEPYFNQTRELRLDPKKRTEVRAQKSSVRLSQSNKNLFRAGEVAAHLSATKQLIRETSKTVGVVSSEAEKLPVIKTIPMNLGSTQLMAQYPDTLEREKTEQIRSYTTELNSRTANLMDNYRSTTFDRKEFSPPRPPHQQFKGETIFLKDLLQQQQQLEAFKQPPPPPPPKVNTKERFNVQLPQIHEQDKKDLYIMQLLYPQLYAEKVDPKKVEQEELRRKINRIKEQEMLERNLRNKL